MHQHLVSPSQRRVMHLPLVQMVGKEMKAKKQKGTSTKSSLRNWILRWVTMRMGMMKMRRMTKTMKARKRMMTTMTKRSNRRSC